MVGEGLVTLRDLIGQSSVINENEGMGSFYVKRGSYGISASRI